VAPVFDAFLFGTTNTGDAVFMQIYFIAIVLLSGFSVYLWRGKKSLAQQLLRAETEHSVLKAGRRSKELFDNASDAIFIVAVESRGAFHFESLNPVAIQIFDRDGVGFEGLHFDEIARRAANPELGRILRELSSHLARAVASGLPVKYESAFSFIPEAAPGVFDIGLVPMADDGGISHILCFARDITARKLYEQELLERGKLKEQLSGFAGSAPGFFYSYRHGADGSNTMPFASAGINELFGLRPEDVAPNIAPLSLLIHRDDLQIFFAETARSAVDLSPLSVEFRASHPGKGELWIESRAMPVAEADGSIVWHGFMHNVTERKKMETVLRRSQENLSEAQRIGQMGSWELDLTGGGLIWSDEIFRIFEIDAARFGASYEAFLNAIHPDDREAVNAAYTKSLEDRTPYSIDHRLRFADGRIKHVRECCETYYAEDGTPLRSHGTVQDITALKETESQLKNMQEKLRELVLSREALREEERKRISWEMHEELGQLLAGIKMRMYGIRSQMPKDNPTLNEDNRAIVGLIDKSIQTIRDIVSDLRPTVLLHGVAASLEWVVVEFNRHPDMVCELEINEDGTPVSEELTTLVFRVVQESLENIARHTGVSRVVVTWTSNREGHCLTIRHNGETCTSDFIEDKSLSLFGIQERVLAFGGEMQMFSGLQHGLVLEAIFPA
jgi:signal transduction histidine kinase